MGRPHDRTRTTSPAGAPPVQRQRWLAADADAVREAFGDAHGGRAERAVAEDRDRIARELHDQVVQRLFGMGLALASAAGACPDAATRSRLVALTEEVDATIRTVRRTVYDLQRGHEQG